MKKFFLFAAAVVAAMTVNAKTYNFGGITADKLTTAGTIGTYVMDEVEIPSISVAADVDANVTIDGMEDLVINYKNSGGKNNILKFAADYLQADGKGVILSFSNVPAGSEIKLTVSAKGSTDAIFNALKGASGADQTVSKIEKVEDYVVVTFTATDADVQIKETNGGYRIVKAVIGADEQGIEDVKDAVKSEKFFRDGQLIIRKNGVEYNALGTQL